MRAIAAFAAGVLLLGTQASAQNSAPPVYVPPTSRAVQGGAVSVVVLPFAPAGGAEKSDWIGKGVQQDLAADLLRMTRASIVMQSTAASADDLEDAVRAGRQAAATYVVHGSFQALESDIRITGQVVDVASGKPVAGLKATGSRRDLFHLEDALAAQVLGALPREVVTAPPQQPTPPAPTARAPAAPAPDDYTYVPRTPAVPTAPADPGYDSIAAPDTYPDAVYAPQVSTYNYYSDAYPYSDSGYDYPYYGTPYYGYGYGYPYVSGGVFLGIGSRFGHYGHYNNHYSHYYGGSNHYSGGIGGTRGFAGGSRGFIGGRVGSRNFLSGGVGGRISGGTHFSTGVGGAHIGGSAGGAHSGGGGGGGHAGGGHR